MILKIMQTVVQELPKLESGADAATKAQKLNAWRGAMDQAVLPTGPHVKAWWAWCQDKAEKAYSRFLEAMIKDREAIFPRDKMPVAWEQIDSWMRPKLLEVVPKNVKDWVTQRANNKQIDESHVIVFYLMKTYAPGSPEEKDTLHKCILNPHCCSNPKSAQVELIKWKEHVKRYHALGCASPDITMSYRAMESIFFCSF